MGERIRSAVHDRKSTRIPGFDYRQPATYFVTLVTHQRACIFGTINEGEVCLNRLAQIAKVEWERIPNVWPLTRLDTCMIMPNHIHGLITIDPPGEGVGATRSNQVFFPADGRVAPVMKSGRPCGPPPGSLGAIIGQFKSRVTLHISRMEGHKIDVWQRNYFEHIVRDNDDYLRIRQYIIDNPSQWREDGENPEGSQWMLLGMGDPR